MSRGYDGFTASNIFYFDYPDETEIYLRPNVATFIPNWDKVEDLTLEVNAVDSNGDTTTYGPFDEKSGLKFILFKTKNYFLKLTYDGAGSNNITMLFSTRFPRNNKLYEGYDQYETFDDVKSIFLYKFDDKEKSSRSFKIFIIVLLVLAWVLYICIGFCKGEDDYSD